MQLNSWALCAPWMPREDIPKSREPIQFYWSGAIPNWTNLHVQLIAEHSALLGPPEGMMSCIPDIQSALTEALPYQIEPKNKCSWIAEHCVLPRCPEANLIWPKLYQSKLNQNTCASDSWVLFAPRVPKGNVLKSREPVRFYQNVSLPSSTRLHVQLNSWALCALQMPKGNGLNSHDLTRFHQNCSSPNWIKVQIQPVDSWALCSPWTPKGYVLKSCEPIWCYQSVSIPMNQTAYAIE